MIQVHLFHTAMCCLLLSRPIRHRPRDTKGYRRPASKPQFEETANISYCKINQTTPKRIKTTTKIHYAITWKRHKSTTKTFKISIKRWRDDEYHEKTTKLNTKTTKTTKTKQSQGHIKCPKDILNNCYKTLKITTKKCKPSVKRQKTTSRHKMNTNRYTMTAYSVLVLDLFQSEGLTHM